MVALASEGAEPFVCMNSLRAARQSTSILAYGMVNTYLITPNASTFNGKFEASTRKVARIDAQYLNFSTNVNPQKH
jgi:hypothetical protein